MSVEEAASYFRVGINKLRRIISEDANADFILWNGNRAQIKRRKFEEYMYGRTNLICHAPATTERSIYAS